MRGRDISAGSNLGPYTILAHIGAGGMGEVWKARDTRLDRTVAIKFLLQEFSERFEREARTIAALNHPNIAQIYDVGDNYLVMEYVDGEPLRRPESVTRLLEIAVQIADGLAAAHAAGIVHRDLKPDNILLTKDGRVKLLDFGIARHTRFLAEQEETKTDGATLEGKVVGTVTYMSPEQVRGEPADHRSDIFSFGIVLYELVTGSRPFQHATSTETMAAILRADVPELPVQTPPALTRIIAHALEKQPDRRFQSTNDMAFALRNVSLSTTTTASHSLPAAISRRAWIRGGAAAAGLVAAGGLGYWGGRKSARLPPAIFRKVPIGTATRVTDPRFAADGETVVYTDRRRDGSHLAVVGRSEQTPRELNVPDLVQLLTVSPSNELAVLLKGNVLARMPLFGGGARKLLEGVIDADWTPGADSLAVLREGKGDKASIEWPLGKVVAQIPGASKIRVSPDGKRIVVAHSDGPASTHLTVFQASGERFEVANFKGSTLNALPYWSPNGREVWISSPVDEERTIYAIDLRGNRRIMLTLAGVAILGAISPRGRLLINLIDQRFGSAGMAPGSSSEQDLSLSDEYAYYSPLAADGKTYAYTTFNTDPPATFLRRLDERQVVRLCEGTVGGTISPDLRWVPVRRARPHPSTLLAPTGAGTETEIALPGMLPPFILGWLQNGAMVLGAASVSDHITRLLIWNPSERKSRVLANGPFNGGTALCDPQSRFCLAQPAESNWKLYRVDGSPPADVHGIDRGDNPLGFTADGNDVYVTSGDIEETASVWLVSWATGKRRLWKEFSAPHGRQFHMWQMQIAPNGASYVYQYEEYRSALYTVDGLS